METDIKTTRKRKAAATTTDSVLEAGPPADGRSCITAELMGETKYYLPMVPTEWQYFRGLGWIHDSENTLISKYCRRCEVTGLWGFSGRMMRTIYSGTKAYVHPSVTEAPFHWKMCYSTSRVAEQKDMLAVRAGDNKSVWVSRAIALDKSRFETCPLSGDIWNTEHMVHVKYPHTPGLVAYSNYHARKNPEKFSECPKCGYVHERAGFKESTDGHHVCNDCFTTYVLSKIIHKHDYNGYPPIRRSGSTRWLMVNGKPKQVVDECHRLFGVECEVEIHDGCPLNRFELAFNIQKVLGKEFVVMKNDGSLKNHPREHPLWGFEIVTAPADLQEHMARWAELEKAEGFRYLRAWDTTTCGLHIHIGKAYMTTLQIGRIMQFITAKKNRKFIEKVAGRNSEAASRFVDKGLDGGLKPDPDKYCAVNIRPPHTIEFRIFRGTIRHQHIVRNLEFTDAVCSFCHPASRAFHEMKDYRFFLDFCAKNRKAYPYFTKWLGEQEYIPPAKVKPGTEPEPSVEKDTVTDEVAPKWY